MSYVVFARATRYAGAAATIALLTLAAPVTANANGGTSCLSHGDSRHLGDRTLCQGMHGHDVRVLQQYLTFAGFPTTIDGAFGSTTRRNVIVFQRAQHMAPTGIVTFSVQQILREAVKAVTASQPSQQPVAGARAQINSDGTAGAPAGAPAAVQQVINAANQIISTSYCVGGGHGSWNSSCYDCSGAVSFALHGGGLLSSPEDSTGLESYGAAGAGRWISVYADAGHAFLVVAGRAFDTANFGGPNWPSGSGPRWRSDPTGNLQDGGGYVLRHPAAL